MTREEAKKILKTPGRVIPDVTAGNDEESCRYNIENKMAIETAIEALDQEYCEDCISRTDTLKPYESLKDDDVISVWLVKKNIEQQKTVTPRIEYGNDGNPYRLSISNGKEYEQEPKTGKWIWCGGSHKCSNCGEYTCFSHKEMLRYCPNCGVKMIKN